jgi:transposase
MVPVEFTSRALCRWGLVVDAGVILTLPVGAKPTHLGEDGGFCPPTMLTHEPAVEIKVLACRGVGIREIAKQLGCSRNTVRRYLRDQEAQRYGPRSMRPTKLDAYKDVLRERVEAARPHRIPAVVLHREIQELGYEGGITQLKEFINGLRDVKADPVVRFETPPGKQMQARFHAYSARLRSTDRVRGDVGL